ncbi:uncharacterized protein [Amphiura filiformis]|uniref:uncharacterized protein isoform X7 n=1 Tax=Amphiura filiformis TaxID=82378 RepID=UPI003B223745
MAEDGETTHLTNGDMEPSDLTNGDMEPSHLTNGDMQPEDAETHEMTDMNGKEGFEPEKGRKNEGYEGEEEAVYMPNGTTENKDPVIRADSGVEIDGTDSENNGDRGASPQNGMVDEEDGLFESFAETITGLELSLTESELTEATERGSTAASIAWNTSEDKDRHPSFVATPATEDAPSSATDVKVVSPVPTPPDYPPPPPPPQRGTEPTTKCTLRTDGDTGENTCIKESLKKPVTLDVTSEEETDSETEYDNASDLPWPKASSDSPEKHFVYVGTLDPGIDSNEETQLIDSQTTPEPTDPTVQVDIGDPDDDPTETADTRDPEELSLTEVETATEYENHEGGTLTGYDNATYEVETPADGLETPTYTPPDSPAEDRKYESAVNMENGDAEDKFRFVQHEGVDDETTRAESRKKFKRKTDCKCICLSILCFIVMILAAAFAFFLAMFFVGSLDGFLGREATEEGPPPQRPQGMMVEAPPIQMITTLAQISLDLDWQMAFDFPSSPERTEIQYNVIRDLDNIFRWGSTEYVYWKTEIDEFRRGPFGENVFVKFTSFFYNVPDGMITVPEGTTSPSTDELYDFAREDMSQIVFELLATAIDGGRFQSVTVERGTLELLLTEITEGTRRMTVEAPPIQMITTLAQISLDLDWQVAFDFPSSPERTEIQDNVTRDLDNIFRWGSTEYVYWKTEIDDFRRGPFGESVFVKFTSFFYNVPDGMITVPEGTTSPSTDELYEFAREDMSQIVFELLATAIDGGRFESVTVERGTLELLSTEITEGTRR